MSHPGSAPSWWAPTALERASGVVLGVADHQLPTSAVPSLPTSPLAALEAFVLPAVLRTPCVVSFSGGMDSSFLLAVATRVARREGLADPVPVTWRFTDAPRAAESGWQDDVVRSLDLHDHVVLRADDDLDLIGPVARKVLQRYGVVHPPNLHLHVPILELAGGGAVLTGFGGDQVLAGFGRSTTPSRRLIDRLPTDARVHWRMLRGRDPFPWLRTAVSRDVQRRLLDERRSQPDALADRISWHLRRRDLRVTEKQFDVVATDLDVLAVHPFLAPEFHAALEGCDVPTGPSGRADALNMMGGNVFPRAVWAPRPKARFHEVFVRRRTREFAAAWDGDGIDTDLVDADLIDADALKRLWRTAPFSVGSALLVQQLWLDADTRPASGAATTPGN